MNFPSVLQYVIDAFSSVWNIQTALFNEAGSLFFITFITLFIAYSFVRLFLGRVLADFSGSSDTAQKKPVKGNKSNG